jgi:transposase
MTTKILALTDALGNLVRFVLLPGQRYDTVGIAPLIEGVEFGALIADKAFDSNHIIATLNERGAKVLWSAVGCPESARADNADVRGSAAPAAYGSCQSQS